MLQRYTFIVFLSVLISGLGWWSNYFESALFQSLRSKSEGRGRVPAELAGTANAAGDSFVLEASQRRELLEVLDRMVAYQHYYHSVYGTFTRLPQKTGYDVPRSVASRYEIRVTEATPDRLLVTASSEVGGRAVDLASIDQDYRVQANFALPLPRPEYLRSAAYRHLRALRELPKGQIIEEQGVFKGFFRFEVKQDSNDQKGAFAVGIRPPVLGMQLEYGPSRGSASTRDGLSLDVQSPDYEDYQDHQATGQQPRAQVLEDVEQRHLAQAIFRGEVGRYARDLAELSRIAGFEKVPGGESEQITQASDRAPSSTNGSELELEIEPISSEK